MKKKTNTVVDVARNVLEYLDFLKEENYDRLDIRSVCDELNIFDWWKETLSRSNLKQMYSFLELAHELGLTGYCCFKVGVKGYTNGMWAYENDAVNEQSPRTGKCIYRSFLGDNYGKQYSFDMGDGEGFSETKYKTINDLKKAFLAAQAK